MNRKGMEMWQLVLIILALLLLLFVLGWYGGLGETLTGLFDQMGALFG